MNLHRNIRTNKPSAQQKFKEQLTHISKILKALDDIIRCHLYWTPNQYDQHIENLETFLIRQMSNRRKLIQMDVPHLQLQLQHREKHLVINYQRLLMLKNIHNG